MEMRWRSPPESWPPDSPSVDAYCSVMSSIKSWAWAARAAATLVALAMPAASAVAATVEPLNQYEVSGRVTADQLARDGYDLTESGAHRGTFDIVATAAHRPRDIVRRPMRPVGPERKTFT